MALPKLIVVLGTTACGKSGLGVELAKRFGGEIVSADSRQVYRGLDLGTGKVTEGEMEGVPHHMLDVVEPNQPYSVAEFQAGAYAAIDGILSRGGEPGCTSGRLPRASPSPTPGPTRPSGRSWRERPQRSSTPCCGKRPASPSPTGRSSTASGLCARWRRPSPASGRAPRPAPGTTACCWG